MPNKNTPKENQENTKVVLTARTGNALAALRKVRQSKERKETRKTITVKDKVTLEPLISFQIRALSEREYEKARQDGADKLPNGNSRRNMANERSELIYAATVDEDKCLWDAPDILDDYDTNFPRDVIEDTFDAGDKLAIVNAIDTLSGFGENSQTVDVVDEVKN